MKRTHLALFLICFLAVTGLSHAADDFYFTSTKKYDHVLVEKVITTDTIRLEGGEKIKLIGLKAPRPPRRDKIETDERGFIVVPEDVNPETPIEQRALDFAKALLEGKYVRLEFDTQRKTDNFETLAYVYLDKALVNAEILKQGFADLQIAPPNLKYAELLRAAYREGRTEKRGLHNDE
jgi:micrococcal nuclease